MRLYTLVVLLCGIWAMVLGQTSPPVLSKAMQKECRLFYKQLKAEDWKVWEMPQSLNSAVNTYYEKLAAEGEDITVIVGTGTAKTSATAKHKAEIHAKSQYASTLGSMVDSRFSMTEVNNGHGGDSTNLALGVNVNTSNKVKLPKPSLTIWRSLPDNTTEVRIYYLITQ